MEACQSQLFVLEIARQWGKSRLDSTIAVADCLEEPGARVAYGCSTLKSLQEFVNPTIEAIIADFPVDCRPTFNAQESHWNFPNGSWIHLFSCEDMAKARRARGPKAKRIILDEAAFIPILKQVVEDVLLPQLTHLKSHERPCAFIVSSSPASEPDHHFTAMAEIAEAIGAFASRTIHDNPLLTPEQISSLIAQQALMSGLSVEDYMRTDTFQREYLARRIIDRLLSVLPEWADARKTQLVALPRPEFFDAQVTLDFGGVDPHAAHFGYLDFHRAAYVIEDEVLLRDGENTEQLVRALKEKERQLWGTDRWAGTLRAIQERHENVFCPDWIQAEIDEEAPKQPRVRWADNDIQLCRDLHELHGYSVVPTAKDNLELQVNRLRLMVGELKVFVHPRCVHTDRHWRSTTWANHRRQDFARKANEHGDLLACGVYGTRNLDRSRNPFPPNWGLPPGTRIREAPRLTAAQRLGRALKS